MYLHIIEFLKWLKIKNDSRKQILFESTNIYKYKEILDWHLCYFYENTYVLFHFEEQKFNSIYFEDKM